MFIALPCTVFFFPPVINKWISKCKMPIDYFWRKKKAGKRLRNGCLVFPKICHPEMCLVWHTWEWVLACKFWIQRSSEIIRKSNFVRLCADNVWNSGWSDNWERIGKRTRKRGGFGDFERTGLKFVCRHLGHITGGWFFSLCRQS